MDRKDCNMKKKLLAMFLCVNMLFSALAPLVYCIGTGEDDIKISSGENVAAQSSST